ncbi:MULTISPECIES: sigma-70 family RNA polymerase sigma factor [Paraliobacillus]|uniref:sigma-70 family RNA polymerase sigma factor n=1 Tax=Paraliobacillus TaxID=200903 RepID=UPI000DD3E2A0|nr:MULTISPECIES: sigma-70 family RNA polymerase sigma factor [Paraliobacillus]
MIDQSEVNLAKADDKDAFLRLIIACQNTLYRVSKVILKHDDDCADVIQETIKKSYYSVDKLKKQQDFKTWLTQLLINQCYAHLKEQDKVISSEPLDYPIQLIDQEEATVYDQLSKGMDNLSITHKVIITLFYYEQFNIQDIATILNINESTVKSRLNYAHNNLASYLKIDQVEKNEKENDEPSEIIKKSIEQTLDDLPKSNRKRRFILSPAAIKFWSVGIVCMIFFVFLYFQFNDSPLTQTDPSTDTNIDDTFRYAESPVETDQLAEVIEEQLGDQMLEEDIDNITLLTSVKQIDRWIVLVQFEMSFPGYYALIEVKQENNAYSKRLLTLSYENNADYFHWYDETEGVGFGSGSAFSEKAIIETSNMKLSSHLHDDYYIYLSNEKPVKVSLFNENGEVNRTLEAFNFDEVYPLIAENEDEYALFVVDNRTSFDYDILDQEGVKNVTSAQTIDSLESANQQYQFLNLEKSPAYVVFDDTEMIYKTYEIDELLEFLKQVD